jgi:chemotaxis methyl-accepting protein methylase
VPDAEKAQLGKGNIERLISRVSEAHGINLSLYRQPYLERRLAARMRVVGISSYRRYGDLLDSDPSEYSRFLDTLTINVTEFFRDAEMWASLRRNVLPELISRKRATRNRSIRIWSAGCATGEEPYSVTMMLMDALGADLSDFAVSVLATDIDPSALARARQGVFETHKARHIPADYRLRYTASAGPAQFKLADDVRAMIRFRKMSLFDDTPVRVVDLVLCRNVFIYFDREQQARVMAHFVHAMAPGGYLVLGRSEKLSDAAAGVLQAVDGGERIYRKRGRT